MSIMTTSNINTTIIIIIFILPWASVSQSSPVKVSL